MFYDLGSLCFSVLEVSAEMAPGPEILFSASLRRSPGIPHVSFYLQHFVLDLRTSISLLTLPICSCTYLLHPLGLLAFNHIVVSKSISDNPNILPPLIRIVIRIVVYCLSYALQFSPIVGHNARCKDCCKQACGDGGCAIEEGKRSLVPWWGLRLLVRFWSVNLTSVARFSFPWTAWPEGLQLGRPYESWVFPFPQVSWTLIIPQQVGL